MAISVVGFDLSTSFFQSTLPDAKPSNHLTTRRNRQPDAKLLPHPPTIITVEYVSFVGCIWSFCPGAGPYFSLKLQSYLAVKFEGAR
jgi:hypothetical protein